MHCHRDIAGNLYYAAPRFCATADRKEAKLLLCTCSAVASVIILPPAFGCLLFGTVHFVMIDSVLRKYSVRISTCNFPRRRASDQNVLRPRYPVLRHLKDGKRNARQTGTTLNSGRAGTTSTSPNDSNLRGNIPASQSGLMAGK